MKRLQLGLLMVLATACKGQDNTLIVVEVGSELAVPSQLDAVRIEVTGPTAGSSNIYPLSSSRELPIRLALVPDAANDASLTVKATGMLEHIEIVWQAVRVAFVPGESKLLRLNLTSQCAYVTCSPTQSCSAGRCTPVPTVTEIPDYVPESSAPANGGSGGMVAGAGGSGSTGGVIATGGDPFVPGMGGVGPMGGGGSGGLTSVAGRSSTGGTSGTGGIFSSSNPNACTELPPAPAFDVAPLPCAVIAKDGGGATCVTAHSTVRVIVPGYAGPLYQLCKGSSKPGPGSCQGTPLDIQAKDGTADVDAHNVFCANETCTISKIYDQSGKGNDLEPAPKGGAKTTPANPAKASALPVIINGRKAYGVLIKAGIGYRAGCNGCTLKQGNGMASGDEPQTVYMVTSQKDLIDGCCFDYGNAETTCNDDGNGSIEAVYFGGGVVWGSGFGGKPGPWVMADLENGLYAGWENRQDKNISTNKPLKFDFVTAVLVGDTSEKNIGKGRFALYGADAQGKDATLGKLTCMFDGPRPEKAGYAPMQKQGLLVLGISGDNSNGGGGRFYEGATIVGPLVSKTTLSFLHAVVVAAKYAN